jgi:hypothetical protein
MHGTANQYCWTILSYIDLLSTDTARVSCGYEQNAVNAAGLASRSQGSMRDDVLKKQKILE